MNGRSLMVLVLAVVLGLGAMLVTRRLMSKPAAAEEESQEILVAARDFKEEEILKPDMVKTVRMARQPFRSARSPRSRTWRSAGSRRPCWKATRSWTRSSGPRGRLRDWSQTFPRACGPSRSRSTSSRASPGSSSPAIAWTWCGTRPTRRAQQQRGETILQDVLVLAAGQVFTRPEEKSLQTRTVTAGGHARTGGYPGRRQGEGASVALAPRGQRPRRSSIVPSRKPEESEEAEGRQGQAGERARRKLKLALAKKLAEPPPPPPPPAPKPPEPKPPEQR